MMKRTQIPSFANEEMWNFLIEVFRRVYYIEWFDFAFESRSAIKLFKEKYGHLLKEEQIEELIKLAWQKVEKDENGLAYKAALESPEVNVCINNDEFWWRFRDYVHTLETYNFKGFDAQEKYDNMLKYAVRYGELKDYSPTPFLSNDDIDKLRIVALTKQEDLDKIQNLKRKYYDFNSNIHELLVRRAEYYVGASHYSPAFIRLIFRSCISASWVGFYNTILKQAINDPEFNTSLRIDDKGNFYNTKSSEAYRDGKRSLDNLGIKNRTRFTNKRWKGGI